MYFLPALHIFSHIPFTFFLSFFPSCLALVGCRCNTCWGVFSSSKISLCLPNFLYFCEISLCFLELFFSKGQTKASQHWQTEGKRRWEEKWLIFYCPWSGTILKLTRPTLVLSWQKFGWLLRQSTSGPFRALPCKHEQKLETCVSFLDSGDSLPW